MFCCNGEVAAGVCMMVRLRLSGRRSSAPSAKDHGGAAGEGC